jgi:hypothetical protein
MPKKTSVRTPLGFLSTWLVSEPVAVGRKLEIAFKESRLQDEAALAESMNKFTTFRR